MGKKREVENEWEASGAIQEVSSSGQIGQLNARRFEMQSGKNNLSRRKVGEILENEIPVMGEEIPKEKLTNMG